MTTQTELTEWQYILYADISGQLKRLGLSAGHFDGLLLRKDSHAGSWLHHELNTKYIEFGNKRDDASVLVSSSAIDVEPWKLTWRVSVGFAATIVFYSMYTLPDPTRSDTEDISKLLEISPEDNVRDGTGT